MKNHIIITSILFYFVVISSVMAQIIYEDKTQLTQEETLRIFSIVDGTKYVNEFEDFIDGYSIDNRRYEALKIIKKPIKTMNGVYRINGWKYYLSSDFFEKKSCQNLNNGKCHRQRLSFVKPNDDPILEINLKNYSPLILLNSRFDEATIAELLWVSHYSLNELIEEKNNPIRVVGNDVSEWVKDADLKNFIPVSFELISSNEYCKRAEYNYDCDRNYFLIVYGNEKFSYDIFVKIIKKNFIHPTYDLSIEVGPIP